MIDITHCTACPRQCGANRTVAAGFCGADHRILAARAALHGWEEPCISGTKGSGTIFFSNCPLRCVFCQNAQISQNGFGEEITPNRFLEICFELAERGAHNINLVNPVHYIPLLLPSLQKLKQELPIPIVYNSGGYESVATLKQLDGLIDIYLPDFKFYSSILSKQYCQAEDYAPIALQAIHEMVRQTGKPVFSKEGLLLQGTMIRHLVLPNAMHDSMHVLDLIAREFPAQSVLISLMSQYTPCHRSHEFKALNRRVSTYEYQKVYDHLLKLGLTNGYAQERSSAKEEYIPPFDLSGI